MLAKLEKLKKLLDIDDTYIGISGLKFEEKEDPLENALVNDVEALVIDCDKEKKCKKPNSLKISPIDVEGDEYYTVNEFLPKIPFSLLNCGSRGAGKSVLTLNILEMMGSHFDKIFIFSPTIELDFKYKMVLERLNIEYSPGKNIFFDYNEDTMKRILDKIKHFNKGKRFKDKSKILMIFDDIVTMLPKNKRRTIFNRLILNNRHYNISTIMNSQTFKLLDSNFRKVASQIILFKTDNTIELDGYIKELSGMLGKTIGECRRTFNNIYRYATAEPHTFLFINMHHPNVLFRNLDEPIVIQNFKDAKDLNTI